MEPRKPPMTVKRGEESRRRPHIHAHDVDRRETKRLDRAPDKPTHLLRREEIVTPFRAPEAGQVDREHVEQAREPNPHGENAKMLSGHGLRSSTFSSPAPALA